MKEMQLITLARNALLVAGHEMGKTGDHWPVIKATIQGIMKDYEELQTERRISEELQDHLGQIVGEYEQLLNDCSPELRAELEPVIREMREVYEAAAADVPVTAMPAPEDKDAPGFVPWRSAQTIIKSLTEKDDEKV